MWPFSLLKKLSQDPAVGQTRGDYIGCYLLGTHTSGRDDDISYISLATTREQLQQDARQYLQEFLQQHRNWPLPSVLPYRTCWKTGTYVPTPIWLWRTASPASPWPFKAAAIVPAHRHAGTQKEKGVYLE